MTLCTCCNAQHSARGSGKVCVIVVGQLRNMLEPVVADSLHLLVTPLQRYAGRSVSTALLGVQVHFRCKHVTDLLFSYGTYCRVSTCTFVLRTNSHT